MPLFHFIQLNNIIFTFSLVSFYFICRLLENFHIYSYIVLTFCVSKYTHCIPIYGSVLTE